MSADEQGRELESEQPKGAGAYYTPEQLASYHHGHAYYVRGRTLEQCHNEAMKAGWLAAERAYVIDAERKAAKAKLVEPTSGSGAFLKEAADDLTKNPPYNSGA